MEALKSGYKILKIYEVWHYNEKMDYEKDSKSGLFAEYVDLFLKFKQEASGYLENVITEDQRDEYVKNYLENEGIQLNKNNINNNPGLRSVMKLMLKLSLSIIETIR